MDLESLSHPQRQIWIGQQLHADKPLYNMAFSFLFSEPLREDLFVQAWSELCDAPVRVKHFPDVSAFSAWCERRTARFVPPEEELTECVLAEIGGDRSAWFLRQHHLITDAGSMRILYRRVAQAYELLERGLSIPNRVYPDYTNVVDTLRERTRQLGDKSKAHWMKRQGITYSLYGRELTPVDTPSTRHRLTLSLEQSRQLNQLALQRGFKSPSVEISRFAVFSALLISWLYRISGEKRLGFDAPAGGRPTAESKETLGLFIEMFPFNVELSDGMSFRGVGELCLRESLLFLTNALPGGSKPSEKGASQVVLNYVPGEFGRFSNQQPEIQWIHPGHGDKVHALRLQVHDFEGAGAYTLDFDWNNHSLPADLCERSLLHFELLLDAVLGDPDQILGEIALGTPADLTAYNSLNNVPAAGLGSDSLWTLFERQVVARPDSVALREADVRVTFKQLYSRVEAFAGRLASLGVGPGDRVLVHCRRSKETVIAILATLRLGAAYIPLDTATPSERVAKIQDDADPKLTLGQDHPLMTQPITDVAPAGLPKPDACDVAYIIYTSGSTGAPKGVVVQHNAVVNYLSWAERQYVRGERLNYALFTSLSFDLTVTSLFLPLVTGGELHIYPEPEGPVDAALLAVIEDDRIDFLKLTPSHLQLLLRASPANSRLSRIVIGGENLTTRLASRVSALWDDQVEIYNEYGPTEAVVGCVVHRFDPESDVGTNVPIGKPSDGFVVEVKSPEGAIVPAGVVGELWLSSERLAREYYGQDRLTRSRFLQHDGKRSYRTGDLVRLHNGQLEYLGRLDRQLKIMGVRVEPAEVESALLSIDGVQQVALVTRKRPIAHVSRERIKHCTRCGLASNYPGSGLDESDVCRICLAYDRVKPHAAAYFSTIEALQRLFEDRPSTSDYDCMMLYSGGKDSSYALCQLVEMGLRVYAFTLDNGFISEGAKDNIRSITQALGVPVEFASTPAMNLIFRESLSRFSNVCNGCFKTIYTLSLKRARELEIPTIVTGLSRGQMFETRLTEEMFRNGSRSPEQIDAAVLAARKRYHRTKDAASRMLNDDMFEDDRIFEEVHIVDFYRYCDVGLDEVYSYLGTKMPWVRPADTGRSTNCLINDLGIHKHQKERGYHNYSLPYSWDVRLGHKTRQEALDELDDDIAEEYVTETMLKLGYQAHEIHGAADQLSLEAFFVPSAAAKSSNSLGEEDLRARLETLLPPQWIPTRLNPVDSIPLTVNGKLDEAALGEVAAGVALAAYRKPDGPIEEYLVEIWQQELDLARVGAGDSFFNLGGNSLAAMEVMIQLCDEFAIDLPLETLFQYPKLSDFARVVEDHILAESD